MKRFKVLVIAVALAFPCGVNAETNEMFQVLSSKVESLIVDGSNRIEKQCCKIEQEQAMRFEAMVNSFVSNADNTLVKIQKNGESKINAVVTEKGFYEKRYEELKAGHDQFLAWLSVCMIAVGFLVTIFGVVMPIVVSFHQYKSYENDLNRLHKEITAEREEAERGLQDEVSKVRGQNFVALHYSVAENVCRMSTMSLKEGELGNATLFLGGVILGVHYVIESAMRVGKKDLVIKAIDSFEDFVKRWREGDELHRRVWTSALKGLHTAVTNDEMALTKKDYVKILGNDTKYLGWLEEFYKNFAEWKFA